MDTFPEELVVKILSLIKDGKDVPRLKQLNSHFQRVIDGNRPFIRRPRYTIVVRDYCRKTIEIRFFGKWSCKVNYSKPNSVVIKPSMQSAKYAKRTKLFFAPFFERNASNACLRTVFAYLFDRIDVDCLAVMELSDENVFMAIAESFKASHSTIENFVFALNTPFFTEIHDFLKILIHRKRIYNGKLLTSFRCKPSATQLREFWPRLLQINEIAIHCSEVVLDVCADEAGICMRQIAKEWRKNPFPNFNFSLLFVEYERTMGAQPFTEIENIKNFKVTQTNGEYFRIYSKNCDSASVLMEDKFTGNSILFKKRNYSSAFQDVRRMMIKKVMVDIDVCIR